MKGHRIELGPPIRRLDDILLGGLARVVGAGSRSRRLAQFTQSAAKALKQ